MIDILGKKYITDKEASFRYGMSQKWFIRRRSDGDGPKYIQFKKGSGRVWYPLDETDAWFKQKIKIDE